MSYNARVSLHRVRLHGGRVAPRGVDREAVRAFAQGERTLREALGVEDAAVAALREKAEALFRAGRHGDCVDVLLGLGALDDVAPRDAAMLAESFFALGDPEAGEMCARLYEEVLDAVEDTLQHMEAHA